MKFHHIGIATNDIEETVEKLKKYFEIAEISNTVYDANQDANLCMLTMQDGIKIELIQGKVVENLVKKRQYLYHTCYSVNNIKETIQELEKEGALLVREPKEAILFQNKQVAFLMWNLGLIELLSEGGVTLVTLTFLFFLCCTVINYFLLQNNKPLL